jgi:flavin reductase (DIM6/NTAB) family NADH-FMN oxidoreductase RutF
VPVARDAGPLALEAGPERSFGMDFQHFDLEMSAHRDWNQRWVQPPQIAYLVSTEDKAGNANLTPVTMGTAMASPGYGWWYSFAVFNERDACRNLLEVPECVISYYGPDLTYESWIAALPIPRGISEFDVARLSPLRSQKVKPSGVQECPVNLEMKVHFSQRLGGDGSASLPAGQTGDCNGVRYSLNAAGGRGAGSTMFTGRIVSASIGKDYVRTDVEAVERVGVLFIDPVFEVLIARRQVGPDTPARLYYAKMQSAPLYRDSDDIGCSNDIWTGDFETWMFDEEKRGRISRQEREQLLRLDRQWGKDPDPERNGRAKTTLTEKLREVVWRQP